MHSEKTKRKPRVAVMGLRGFPSIQGGVEKHCEALYPLMKDFDFTVYRRKPYLPPDAPREWKGIAFRDLPSTRIKGFEALFHSFLAACSIIVSRPDIVHIHNIGPGLFAPLLRLFGLKVVATYHSANYEHKKWGALARAILRFGERCTLAGSRRIIFVNKTRYLSQNEKVRRKSALIVNGVADPHPVEGTGFISSLGLRRGEYLLAVGRLTPEKGFDHLVKAMNLIPEGLPLVIAGGADHQPRYLEELKSLDTGGRVIFAGALQGEPLRELYTHARAFILSSVTEGFPLVLLEAMSYSLPVLVSRIDATAHIPQIPSENFFEPADPGSIAEAITRRLPEPGHVSYDMSGYTWASVAAATAGVFRSLLPSSSR